MSMSRREFKAIAKEVKTTLESNLTIEAYSAVAQLTDKIANVMKEHNANFDKAKFFDACGMEMDH